MNKLKKVLAGVTALTCMMSMTSCFNSKQKEEEIKKEKNAEQVQEIMEKSYKAIEFDVDCPLDEIYEMIPIADTGKVLLRGAAGEKYDLKSYITDMEFSEFTELKINFPELENSVNSFLTAIAADGTIFVLATVVDYGDFVLPDYNDPDFDYENFDYEAMEEAAVTKYFLHVLDSEGNAIAENELEELIALSEEVSEDGGYMGISCIFPLGNDKVGVGTDTNDGQKVLVFDKDGKESGSIDLGEDEYLYSYGMTSDGRIAFNSYDSDGNSIKFIDPETMSVSSDKIKMDINVGIDTISQGTGDYILYIKTYTDLLGLKADGTTDELINWVNSDLSGNQITSVIPVENEEFIALEQNWNKNNNTNTFYRLTKRDASEIENVQIINMVVSYTDDEIMNEIKEFNKTNGDYRINVDDYGNYYEWDEESQKQTNTPEKQLKKDISEGKTFDLIFMPDGEGLYSNLSNKDALVDLYSFLEKDTELSKDDILPIVLEAGEYNGKLTSLTPSFSLDTLACKTKYFDKENWTINDLIETYNKLPDGVKLLQRENTKLNVFNTFLYGSSDFIDYKNATCNFNSPDFIQILEFCNQFDNEGEGDSIDWENISDEELQAYWDESDNALRRDKALLGNVYFSDFREYARAVYAEFGDDITLVGYPTANGTGVRMQPSASFAIMKNSDHQEICWNLIKKFFTDEYQESDQLYSIPAKKKAFGKKLDDTMKKPYYIDDDGTKHEYEDMAYYGGEEIEIPPLTKAERDKLEQFILNTKINVSSYSREIYDIIMEEVEAYFKGDKSAEKTAEAIQNRISILISEQA